MMLRNCLNFWNKGFMGAFRFAIVQQYRNLTAYEASVALRPFYFSVHPDLFVRYPEIRKSNENSLKILNGYLRGVMEQGFGGPPIQLTFYLRPLRPDSQLVQENPEYGGFRTVNMDLVSHDLYATVLNILESCNLSTDGLTPPSPAYRLPPDWTEYDEEQIRNFWRRKTGELRRRREKLKSMKFWMHRLGENANKARESYDAVLKLIKTIVEDLCERTGLVEISWESDWSLTHGRACIVALKRILESDAPYSGASLISWGLTGRKVKFCSIGTYLSVEGDLILGTDDVPETWLWLISSARTSGRSPYDTCSDLRREETELSGLLGGATVVGQPGSSMFRYRERLSRLTKQMTATGCRVENMLTEGVDVVIQGCSGNLALVETGQIHVPGNCSPDSLVKFVRDKAPIAKSFKVEHQKRTEEITALHGECVKKLGLGSLTWDCSVPVVALAQCLERLVELEENEQYGDILKGHRIHITRRVSFNQLCDGMIGIPFDWSL